MKIIWLTFFIILSSCSQKSNLSPAETEMKIYNEWIYAYSLENFKQNGLQIERPPGIAQLLFQLKLPVEGGLSIKTQCVYYQVPYKKIKGQLTVEELKSESTCPETPSGDSWVQLEEIKNFKATLESYKLRFDFEKNSKKVSWTFLMPNLEGALVHEKYEAVKEKKWRNGLSLLRATPDTFLNQNNKYLGKLSDRMSTRTAIRCEQIDKSCNRVGENRCDDCRYGWYQVVDFNCPQGGSKFCGQNHCGEKGEPACPRGSKVVDPEEAGICQIDLTPVRNADNILICQ
jgi:hypothetical protein